MKLLIMLFVTIIIMITILTVIFNVLSKKMEKNSTSMSTFECGFNSTFNSRFNFSSQYFMIAMTFLFLDLELCFLMPLLNESTSSFKKIFLMNLFVTIMLLGLFIEWKLKKIEWMK